MKAFLKEFKEFVSRGNVMDMAIGIIIGSAFQTIVNSFVNDVVSPFLGIFLNMDFSNLSLKIGDVEIKYGAFITALFNFFIMALIIFLMVKAMNKAQKQLNNLMGIKENAAPEEVKTKKCPYCMSEIDINAKKCPHCTSDL